MKNVIVLMLGFFILAILAFVPKPADQKPWPVPDAFKTKPNPVKSDATSQNAGKTLYTTYCKSCHGTKGKGDGPKAAQLETECGDFSKPAFQSQTDGSLFYKISEGRKDMPSFKKKITEPNDIWSVVNYLRTLK